MPRVERFEDLIAWQKARALNARLGEVMDQGKFARSWALKDQIERAAASVMANIAEGFDRSGSAEFMHALSIAKGSCAEVRSHLYVALDRSLIDAAAFERLQSDTLEVIRLVAGLRASIARRSATR